MSSANANPTTQTLAHYRLPDPPEREPDEVTSYRYVHNTGNPHFLLRHFGNPESTLVTAENHIAASPGYRPLRRPDLLIAFDVDPQLYDFQNGYIISDQGKPPDFVLEVASKSTAEVDTIQKRNEYAALGIPEYWRFDHTGEFHGDRLAGDRLVGDRYEPIRIIELSPGVLQGESEVLGLWLRWENGQLGWYDPATGQHIPTFDSTQTQLGSTQAQLGSTQAQLAAEREARLASETRVRELEAELRRIRGRESTS